MPLPFFLICATGPNYDFGMTGFQVSVSPTYADGQTALRLKLVVPNILLNCTLLYWQ